MTTETENLTRPDRLTGTFLVRVLALDCVLHSSIKIGQMRKANLTKYHMFAHLYHKDLAIIDLGLLLLEPDNLKVLRRLPDEQF